MDKLFNSSVNWAAINEDGRRLAGSAGAGRLFRVAYNTVLNPEIMGEIVDEETLRYYRRSSFYIVISCAEIRQ